MYLVYFVLPPFWSFRGYLVASRGTWYTSFWLRLLSFGSVLDPSGVLGILYFVLPLFWAWFSLHGYLVYFMLPPFWACFSLQVYLVYFVLPPFWSFRGYLVASRGTWYTSFWLRFGSSGTWYTFFWLRFGSLGSTWYTSFFLRFGLVLASGGTWYTSWCIYSSFGFVLGLF